MKQQNDTSKGDAMCSKQGPNSLAPHNWKESIHAKGIVNHHAGDAHHGRAAIVALSVQLEGLHLRVIVAARKHEP